MPRPLHLAIACVALLCAVPARAAEKVFRYLDEDGVMVISNVAPNGPKKGLAMKDAGDLVKITAPLEFTPRRDTSLYDPYISEACTLYRIPPALARAVMAVESNFNPQALSNKGAQGLMQLMPQTANEMFVKNAFDPKQNIHGGVRYLRILANMFQGDMVQIVAAYNSGPEAVRRAGGAVPNISETQDYVRKVLRLYYAYKNDA